MKKTVFLISLLFLACLVKPASSKGFVEYGIASWYGSKWHGKRTASGEIYNMYAYTAAHRTLPFNTYVLVTNLSNGKSVVVRINDRGPFKRGRIIDLSYAAAKKIGIISSGTAKVRLEIYKLPDGMKDIPIPMYYSVQVGAFQSLANARVWKGKIRGLVWWRIGLPLFIRKEGDLYKVLVGRFKREDEARKWERFFLKRKINAFIVATYK